MVNWCNNELIVLRSIILYKRLKLKARVFLRAVDYGETI